MTKFTSYPLKRPQSQIERRNAPGRDQSKGKVQFTDKPKEMKVEISTIFGLILLWLLPLGVEAQIEAPAGIGPENSRQARLRILSETNHWPSLERLDTNLTSTRKKPQPLTIFGYYRLFLYGRTLTEPYPDLHPYERAYGVGDGYREPMLSVNVMGRPNGKSAFGTELFFFTPYLGTVPQENTFSVNLGVNFYGNFRTEVGAFGLRAGGIHWYNLSPFTIGVYQVLDRFSIFDRTPWEGVNNTEKYNSYFETGAINRGDLRWNNRAFQGVILNGRSLPGNLSFDVFWGKTQPNGGLPAGITDPYATIPNPGEAGNVPNYLGFNGDARVLPSYILGGKLQKKIGKKGMVAYNLIHSQTALDSLEQKQNSQAYSVHTLSYQLDMGKINLSGELGAGSYQSPVYPEKWGEALMVRVKIPKEITWVPLDIQLYQISKNFYNENGEIATNSNPEIQSGFGNRIVAGQAASGGQITQVNQLAHNRRGINLNTGFEWGPARLNLGWGVATEIDPTSARLSYIHRINGLALSRVYNPFPANAQAATVFGPLKRQFSFFRGVFEQVYTTDLDPATALPTTRKVFNTVDLQAKFKTGLFQRPVYLFYLGTLGSAKSEFSLLPGLDRSSYLFVQYHELDLYVEVVKKFILAGYLGLEKAQGGKFTEWDSETQLPRDQLATGFGLGFDLMVAQNAGIFFRHRWFAFEDRSFSAERYRGNEVTIELKTFF